MKVEEIRIGNLVQVNNEKYHTPLKGVMLSVTGMNECRSEKEDGETFSVSLKHINQKPNIYYETYSQFIKFIEPIVLTEELLIRFGLQKVVDGEYSKGNLVFQITKYESGNLVTIFYNGNLINFVHYAHQLQNLVFVLSNEELTLTNEN